MNRYPKLGIRSKNELAKRIAGGALSRGAALTLINRVLVGFDSYWYDSRKSDAKKNKYVRSAVGTPLGQLLELINEKVLAPHDNLIPSFVFGGIHKRNHIQAVRRLLGERRHRAFVFLDIRRFFEQIQKDRVFHLFFNKCGCDRRASQLLARLCCVPEGPKGSGTSQETIARGFATSPRLAVWTNLDVFEKVNRVVRKMLRGNDPRMAIYVDDIGVTASGVSVERMREVSGVIERVLAKGDRNQVLLVNVTKTKVGLVRNGAEYLGLRMGRSKVAVGGKTMSKRDKIREALRRPLPKEERALLLKRRRAYYAYEKQVRAR